jgi:hypothetical protein
MGGFWAQEVAARSNIAMAGRPVFAFEIVIESPSYSKLDFLCILGQKKGDESIERWY